MATDVLADNPAPHHQPTLTQRTLAGVRSSRFRYPLLDRRRPRRRSGQPCRFTLVLEHPGAGRQMFWPFNPVALGEAYIFGDFEVTATLMRSSDCSKYLIALRERLTWRRELSAY